MGSLIWLDLKTIMILFQRRRWHPTPVLLPGKSHGWRSLVGCSPWGHEESDTTEWLHFHFLLSCIREGNGNPLQCSCLENPRDGGAWWAAVYRVIQSQTRLKRLSSSSSMILFPVANRAVVVHGMQWENTTYIKKIFLANLFLAVLSLCCSVWAFSSCSKWGLLSSWGVQTFHWDGFSCCRAWALGYTGFSSCGT